MAAETWADTEAIVRKTFSAALKLPEDNAKAIRFERAHRMGVSNSSSRPKTVVLKFESYKDRDTISQAACKQKQRGTFVNKGFSHGVMERRKEPMPKLREARANGKIAYLVYDRLVIKDRGFPLQNNSFMATIMSMANYLLHTPFYSTDENDVLECNMDNIFETYKHSEYSRCHLEKDVNPENCYYNSTSISCKYNADQQFDNERNINYDGGSLALAS